MFNQIVIVDYTGIQENTIKILQTYSKQTLKTYDEIPTSEQEAIDRIKDADCIFVSWNTILNSNILKAAKNLRYIGMCCSLIDEKSANVDINYAKNNNIVVKGIRDYGDEGVAEYIISELIRLIKGLGDKQWKPEAVELTGRTVGIIGMGTTGKMLADRLQAFGAHIYYYSRNRKIEFENESVQFMELNDLLQKSEIISIHLPKNTEIMKQEEFKIFGKGKILVNTSLGMPFDKKAFELWISNKTNFAIIDGGGVGNNLSYFDSLPNITSTNIVSGWTKEAKIRLSEKILKNMKDFLNDK
ncbi:MAG: dihydrofolate reductase [Marinifilaceae bacterium]|jgi:phosphoglycerate dehydrogenase-like enzyme|nr:dihydrofolate reductase [Marinifilaceae bacterium]